MVIINLSRFPRIFISGRCVAAFVCPLCLFVGMMFLAGCQQQVTSNLPSPNFGAPIVAVAVSSASLPKVKYPPSVKPAAKEIPGIPSAWIPPVAPRPWRYIVIHHSATVSGDAAKFDAEHRAKGWDELGYHFVIGNGTDTADGLVEVGSRWPKQKHGAHAKTPDNRYNDFGIGICLVGNFDRDRPTANQMRSCAKLVAYMMKAYHIPASSVLGHKDTKPTDCPGAHMSVAEVRHMAAQILAESGEAPDFAEPAVAAGELMVDVADEDKLQ